MKYSNYNREALISIIKKQKKELKKAKKEIKRLQKIENCTRWYIWAIEADKDKDWYFNLLEDVL